MLRIVDAIMGTGKTNAAINYMNSNQDKKFIYVAPYLEENERVVSECPNLHFYMPSGQEYPNKYIHFKILLSQGANICISHELFKRIGLDSYDDIRENKYTLILDETIDLIEIYCLSQSDWMIIKQQKLAKVDSNGYWCWNNTEYENGVFSEVKRLMNARTLEMVSERETIWKFPADIFRAFDTIFVLTYLFVGSLMDAYCQMEELPYEFWNIENQNLQYGYKPSDKSTVANLINIYDGNLNRIGEERNSLSSSWFENGRNKAKVKKLKNALYNFFRNVVHSRSKYNMWTCLKSKKKSLSGNGYAKGFVPCNARATNQYREKKTLAYTLNVYLNPVIKLYINSHGGNIKDDNFALSSLLQWMWRSRIRDGLTIDIYLPSKRMRGLLQQWLTN